MREEKKHSQGDLGKRIGPVKPFKNVTLRWIVETFEM
jgi:hypothetical protein